MDPKWLKKAPVEKLLKQFEIRCNTIANHKLHKNAYATEDYIHSQEPDYTSHAKVVGEAQKDLNKLKAEITRRVNDSVPKSKIVNILNNLEREKSSYGKDKGVAKPKVKGEVQ